MKRIHLPDHNPFEEKSKSFFGTKRANRLQKKYESKPFEEEYSLLYYVAIIASYFANTLSALTASTWLFSYAFSIVQELPYPFVIACLFTGIVLLGLEALQRFLAVKFFKTKLQYGYKTYRAKLNTLLSGMLIAALISISLSYAGGFDLITTVTSPPGYEEPELQDIEMVKARYQTMINEADKIASEYYNRRKYQGRIATEDARKYQEYLDKKIAYQDSLLTAVTLTNQANKQAKEKANQEYQTALTQYKEGTRSKGAGLGSAAVFFILLLYLSLWFVEFYDYKTASQYAILVTTASATPETTQPKKQLNQEEYHILLKQMQEQMEALQKQQSNGSSPTSLSDDKLPQDAFPYNEMEQLPLPIGFYSATQREQQLEKLYIQQIKPYKQTFSQNEVVYQDKYTITHRNLKNGKIEHLGFSTVNNRVGIYVLKVQKSLANKNLKAVPNQLNRLQYWVEKRGELLSKVQKSH